jgi:glycosyltransferase involved in cell wall biosynthesis
MATNGLIEMNSNDRATIIGVGATPFPLIDMLLGRIRGVCFFPRRSGTGRLPPRRFPSSLPSARSIQVSLDAQLQGMEPFARQLKMRVPGALWARRWQLRAATVRGWLGDAGVWRGPSRESTCGLLPSCIQPAPKRKMRLSGQLASAAKRSYVYVAAGEITFMHAKYFFPLVSAIIPTCNRMEMLLRAARSVAIQTYPNMELIIVDDDPSGSIKEHLRQEIELQACRVIKNRRKSGGAGARNTGFLESKGKFIGFLDDDDEWMPEKIEKQIEAFQASDDKVGIVTAHNIVIHNSTKIITYRCLEGNVYEALCRKHMVGNTSIPLIKRHVLEEVGLFNEDMPAAQDTELWLRIAKRYHFATVKEPLAILYWHDSERITKNPSKQIIGLYILLRKHWSDLPMQRKYALIKRIVRLTLLKVREQLRC